jgi:hypothetical protein
MQFTSTLVRGAARSTLWRIGSTALIPARLLPIQFSVKQPQRFVSDIDQQHPRMLQCTVSLRRSRIIEKIQILQHSAMDPPQPAERQETIK